MKIYGLNDLNVECDEGGLEGGDEGRDEHDHDEVAREQELRFGYRTPSLQKCLLVKIQGIF